MSSRSKPDGPYFIYALLDPKVYRQTKDELQSIFYVGKGKNSRSHQHEKDVRSALRTEEQLHERLESKAHRIHQILDRGESIPILYLAEGIHNETDAFNAEQLAMTLVDGLLRRTGQGVLTNATSGHNQGVRRVGESELGGISVWEARIRKDEVDIGSRSLDMEDAGQTSIILVKGSRSDLPAHGHRLSRTGILPTQVQEFADRIKLLEFTGEDPITRRGWDPDDPWDDLDARERARRYWQFGIDRVAGWLRNPDSMPTHLLLAIPTRSGETVVRYGWEIDPGGTWEFFPNGNDWGVPLGKRDLDHPFLNRALYETEQGRRTQVLRSRSAGWRHLVK
ncbi:GIY-YIG nuclease family protein [Nocardia cyriacigeorgica]|uniref:GIY-YIG nuclease family protein n=1 Tax=Nocardia cyriacigeorgica TaxID=135487 RepID=UPI002455F957|nr:GIY-YIG nuclease family protein [Nocardia cyriacigeorgica]